MQLNVKMYTKLITIIIISLSQNFQTETVADRGTDNSNVVTKSSASWEYASMVCGVASNGWFGLWSLVRQKSTFSKGITIRLGFFFLFKIEYPSEPILANSAACYFNQIKHFKNKSESGLNFLVNKLSHAVQNSIIDQGEKGETITKILLLNAFDTSVNRLEIDDLLNSAIRYCSYVKVETFVANLYGQTGLNVIKNQLDHVQCEKLLNGYVRFNHFVRAQCSKKQLNLKNLMKRCCAIQCKNKESGVDFVIPVIYSLSENNFD